MKTLDVITFVLLVIGGLNWGLVGLFQYDLVANLFGGVDSPASRAIYILVGLSALYEVLAARPIKRRWHIGHYAPTT